MLSWSCGAPRHAAEPPHAKRPSSFVRAPLEAYVPAAGLRWLVTGNPRALVKNAGTGAFRLLFPKQRVEAFRQVTGIDLEHTGAAVVAGYDLGTLYLASADGFHGLPDQAFAARVVGGPRIVTQEPQLLRLTGVVGTTPQSLVLLENHFVAVATEDVTLGRVVELFARGKLRRTKPALDGAALRGLRHVDDAQLHFYAPGPFTDEWRLAARGLLRNATAVALHARLDQGILHLRGDVTGDFQTGDTAGAVATWRDLAGSSLGRVMHWQRSEPTARGGEGMLTLEVDLDLEQTLVGLYALVGADVDQLMTLPVAQEH